MPRKKEVRNENEFIDSVINAIEEVDTLKELEQKIGEELTPEVLSKIRHRYHIKKTNIIISKNI